MCRAQFVLVLMAWYVGAAHSWDFAVSLGDQLMFYNSDGTQTDTVHFESHKVTAIAYDEVHNRMLYVDKQGDNHAICGYYLTSKENKCFLNSSGRNIHSIAYDPVEEKIFFTDTNDKSVNSISLSGSNDYVKYLLLVGDESPGYIAFDSCRRYIYWGNEKYIEIFYQTNYSDVRAAMLDRRDPSFKFFNFAIDTQTQKIFFINSHTQVNYLNSADLDGSNKHVLKNDVKANEGKEMTVSKDHIYWLNSNGGFDSVWQYPKNPGSGVEPKEIIQFSDSILGLATNYKIDDQIKGVHDCDALSSLLPITEAPATTQRSDVSVCDNYCLQGTCSVNDEGLPKCSCNAGHTGPRCQVDVCLGYCMHGNCSLSDEGHPTCSCDPGYSGERCEVSACHGYCLNDGECSINQEDEPVCQCVGNHEGSRCEADINETNPTYELTKRNLTLADLLFTWRNTSSNIYLTVNFNNSSVTIGGQNGQNFMGPRPDGA